MLYDTVPFEQFYGAGNRSIAIRSVHSFIRFIEKRFATQFTYPISRVPYGKTDLLPIFQIADKLQQAKIIDSYAPVHGPHDEPRIFQWVARYLGHSRSMSGGMSMQSDEHALLAALAEGLERYLWSEATDYYDSPCVMSSLAMATYDANALMPERFVGFSPAQRANNPKLTLTPSDEHLWIRGFSHIQNKKVFLPAQIVSPAFWKSSLLHDKKEQTIWPMITTGLATWPTKEGALLGGALEVIERDAYMILWLNQLSLPRIDLELLRAADMSLDILLKKCEQYRLRAHAIRLLTDAPADVACVVIEDATAQVPLYSIGLKAHQNLTRAIEGAALEALRSRQNARMYVPTDAAAIQKLSAMKPAEVVHFDRHAYWLDPVRAQKLSFLIKGTIQKTDISPWIHDTPTQHFERIKQWCKDAHYEMISVSLDTPKNNPLPWHVEMVVMPDLQPMHQTERTAYLGGTRLQNIPERFGFRARSEPFAKEPHPFA